MLSFMLFFISSHLCNNNKDELMILYNITKKHGKWTINKQSIQKSGVVFDKSRQHRFSEIPRINWRLRFKSDCRPSMDKIRLCYLLMIWIIVYFPSIGKVYKIKSAILCNITIDKLFTRIGMPIDIKYQ